jgi:hypothetical protein
MSGLSPLLYDTQCSTNFRERPDYISNISNPFISLLQRELQDPFQTTHTHPAPDKPSSLFTSSFSYDTWASPTVSYLILFINLAKVAEPSAWTQYL